MTLNWHWLFAAIVAPDKAMPSAPSSSAFHRKPSPLHSPRSSPVGNVSVNATPVSATAFAAGLVIVKVSDVVAFRAMLAGLNALAIDGGATTLMQAEAVPPVPPSIEVTLPVVLFCSARGSSRHIYGERAGAAGRNRSAAQADHVRSLWP